MPHLRAMMAGTLWTIMVPTIPRRALLFQALMRSLLPQIRPYAGQVKVVAWLNAGTPRLAELRDRMLLHADEALGSRYVSFVDDDDVLAPDFVDEIVIALGQGADHVGFPINYFKDGARSYPVEHSLRYPRWATIRLSPARFDYKLVRDFTHIDPMRTKWARAGRFALADPHVAEDRVWCRQLRAAGFARHAGATEVYIDKPLYTYLWTPAESAWDNPAKLLQLGQPDRPTIRHPHFYWHPESL